MHIEDRYTDKEERMIFYDADWNLLPFNINVPLEQRRAAPARRTLKKMLEHGPHTESGLLRRCGWTCILNDGSIKFGEMTFTTESGISRWHPESANEYMGSLIHLPGVDDASTTVKETPCPNRSVPFVPVYKAEKTLDACVAEHPRADVCRL